MTSRPQSRRYLTVSEIIARFSSSETRSTSVTWKAEVLPTIVSVFAPESKSDFIPGSWSGLTPLRRVMPKAQTWACLRFSSWHALEELGVLFVRQGIAPFDEIEAQLVEPLSDQQLILQREVDPFALAAVAERRVVDLDAAHSL